MLSNDANLIVEPYQVGRSIFRTMLFIRRVEERLASEYKKQNMRCPMHLCIGQEAVAAAVSQCLSVHDEVFSGHRAHGHYLAKGGSLTRLVAEMYGLPSGCSKGRGGSMHLTDLQVGFVASTPIVGGTIPLATGAAWAASLKGEDKIVAVYFGDGCFEEGVIHESLNFAALHNLPIVFICENNNYSVYTKLQTRQPHRSIASVARAHGIEAASGDGNDALECYDLARESVEAARAGRGPRFLEFSTHRVLEHCGPNDDEQLGYRASGELEGWLQKCPIKNLREKLVSNRFLDTTELQEIEAAILHEIDEAFDFAHAQGKMQLPQPGCSTYA